MESYLRRNLPKLPDGLLETLKEKVEGKKIIDLPVKYITDAEQDQVRSHEVHDLQEAVARGVKSWPKEFDPADEEVMFRVA